jgi:large subunit ribosomal protein L31e
MQKEEKEEQVSKEIQDQEEIAELPEEITEEETSEELEVLLPERKAERETVEAEEEATAAEEQEAKPRRRKKKEEEEFVEERIYSIPLGKAWVRPPKKRAPRAIQLIRDFITKHMKVEMRVEAEEERSELPRLIISNDVNERVWNRSIKKPPRKIRVRAAKDKDGNVTVFLAEGE